jgi:hypothetical protein
MVEKKPTFQSLTEGAESARPSDIREPFGQSPVPSLEERARLFLRAIHGERDFTSSENAEARSTILNAMAADIATKSNNRTLDEQPVKPPGATTGESGYSAVPAVAMGPTQLVEDRPIYASARRISAAFEDRQEFPRAPAPREYAARIAQGPPPMARASLALRAPSETAVRPTLHARMSDLAPPLPAPTRKSPKRRLFVWGAALSIFAGLGVLGGLAFYQTVTRSVSVTAQSTPGDTPQTAAPDLVQPMYGANRVGVGRSAADAQLPSSSFLSRVRPAPKNLERARTVFAAGDIEAVRIALSRMIESGNASAAVDLGSTYDPNILDALGVRNVPADVAKARVWYQRAQQMGSPDAAGLLEGLERSERPSR